MNNSKSQNRNFWLNANFDKLEMIDDDQLRDVERRRWRWSDYRGCHYRLENVKEGNSLGLPFLSIYLLN